MIRREGRLWLGVLWSESVFQSWNYIWMWMKHVFFAACVLCMSQWQERQAPLSGPSSWSGSLPHALHYPAHLFCGTDPQNPQNITKCLQFLWPSGENQSLCSDRRSSSFACYMLLWHTTHCLILGPHVSVLFAGLLAFSPQTAFLSIFSPGF